MPSSCAASTSASRPSCCACSAPGSSSSEMCARETAKSTPARIGQTIHLNARITGSSGTSQRPVVRAFKWIVWPMRAGVDFAVSLAHISEEEEPGAEQAQQEGLEALVEAAQEEGILARDEAQMIEQVVEFSDK